MIPRLTIPFRYCHSLVISSEFTPFTSPLQTTTSAYPSSSSTTHFPGPHPVKLPLLSTPPLTILPPQSWPPSHHSPLPLFPSPVPYLHSLLPLLIFIPFLILTLSTSSSTNSMGTALPQTVH